MAEKKKKKKRARHEGLKEKAKVLRGQRLRRKGKETDVTDLMSRDAPLVQPEEGVRIVGPAQAMLDYGKPIMEAMEASDLNSMNKAMAIVQLCWNSAVEDDPAEQERMREEAIKLLGTPDAKSFIEMMIERHQQMFPGLKKERGKPSFYMKERVVDEPVEFTPFDESTLNLKDKQIPMTKVENTLTLTLRELDEQIRREDDYGNYEETLIKFEDDLAECYEKWCVAKGVPAQQANGLAFSVHSFLHYLYGYGMGTLLDIPRPAITEFMTTFFIRKCLSHPDDMSMMPAALKLFMRYLQEKGMATYALRNVKDIEALEDKFQRNLRQFINP